MRRERRGGRRWRRGGRRWRGHHVARILSTGRAGVGIDDVAKAQTRRMARVEVSHRAPRAIWGAQVDGLISTNAEPECEIASDAVLVPGIEAAWLHDRIGNEAHHMRSGRIIHPSLIEQLPALERAGDRTNVLELDPVLRHAMGI